jgi:hypothetical protein
MKRMSSNGRNLKLVLSTFLSLVLSSGEMARAQSINPGANLGLASQSGAAGANSAVGNGLMNQGQQNMNQGKQNQNASQIMQGLMQMLKGLMALAQAMADQNAAGQSGAVAAASSADSTAAPVAPPQPTFDGGMAAAFATPQGQQVLAAAQSVGAQVSADGVTFPDGSMANWSQIGGSKGPGSGTLDASAGRIASADAGRLPSGRSALGATSASLEPNAAGGGAHASDFESQRFANPFKLSKADKKFVAGLTVIKNNTLLGVAGDNIFEMVSRVYARKATSKEFVEDGGR